MRRRLLPLVVMGVSGSGKSTVGLALAEELGLTFLDGDDLHSRANVAKMAAGQPLTDEDRWPWLAAVGDALAEGRADIIACSALRRVYRDRIRSRVPKVHFVHLQGGQELVAERLSHRANHFMPAALLGSQFDTLQPLQVDEAGTVIPIALTPAEIVDVVRFAARDASS